MLISIADWIGFQASHVRRDSGASDTTAPSNSPDSPTLPSLDPLSIADRSSVTLPPKIHHRTKPSESHSRRQSVSSKPTAPAFKLIPQPMLDPSKRPIRSSDALVVFPSTAGISQASQKKAKLLIGKDVERYFQLQEKQALVAPGLSLPRAYAYKVVWEKRWSESFVKVMNKVEGGRRMSLAMDVDR